MNQNYNYDRRWEKYLARAYVPFQKMNQVYSASEALKKGTLFPELYQPYYSSRNQKTGGEYYG